MEILRGVNMLQLFVFEVAIPAVTYSMFLDNDPCKIDMWDKR